MWLSCSKGVVNCYQSVEAARSHANERNAAVHFARRRDRGTRSATPRNPCYSGMIEGRGVEDGRLGFSLLLGFSFTIGFLPVVAYGMRRLKLEGEKRGVSESCLGAENSG